MVRAMLAATVAMTCAGCAARSGGPQADVAVHAADEAVVRAVVDSDAIRRRFVEYPDGVVIQAPGLYRLVDTGSYACVVDGRTIAVSWEVDDVPGEDRPYWHAWTLSPDGRFWSLAGGVIH